MSTRQSRWLAVAIGLSGLGTPLWVGAEASEPEGVEATPSPSTEATAAGAEPLSIDDCVRIALAGSATIGQAQAQLADYEARLAEVQSVVYPKLSVLGYAAPMYTVEGDLAGVDRSWEEPGDWGPYLHLEARLTQVLYTFGRLEAGEQAAAAHAEVYGGKLREAELSVALEVRKLAYLLLYTQSVLKTLDKGDEVLTSALAAARERYEAGTGEVDMADLMRLEYESARLRELRVQAESGRELAGSALKHAMGWGDDAVLELALESLPREAPGPSLELSAYLLEAAQAHQY